MTPLGVKVDKKNLGFPGFIRNTFNRAICYCLKYSKNYSYLEAVSLIFASC